MLDKTLLKKKLLLQRADILSRVSSLYADKTMKNGPLDPDLDDQAISLENKGVIDSLDEIERSELEQINNALNRIESSQFGICVSCEAPIPEGRLLALPYTTRCVACASQE